MTRLTKPSSLALPNPTSQKRFPTHNALAVHRIRTYSGWLNNLLRSLSWSWISCARNPRPRKRSPVARYTVYLRIYEKFSFLTRRRGQNGRTLRHSRAMSGSAGLSPSRNRKPEGNTLSGYARNLRKECVGLVAGQAVLTAEIWTAD